MAEYVATAHAAKVDDVPVVVVVVGAADDACALSGA